MASGYSASADVAELVPEITLEADYVYQANALGRQLVTVKDVSGQPGVAVEFPIFTAVSGSSGVAETGTPTSHQMDLSMQTLTVARRSVYTLLGDLAASGASGSLAAQIGKAMGMAQAKMVDTSIFAILNGTTNWGTSAGATDGSLTVTHVLAALLLLEIQEIDESPRAVVQPLTFGKGLRTALTVTANDDAISVSAGEEMNKNASLGRQFGIDWFISPRCSLKTVTQTANCYEGLLFVQSGIGYAVKTVVNGIEPDRMAPTAATGLIMNWYDSAAPIQKQTTSYYGVASLYSSNA